MTYLGFDGEVHRGWMVVHQRVADDVLGAFRHGYRKRFGIRRMRLVDRYDGDDGASMRANNTSAFNCRKVSSGSGWSRHSYGTAIDANPVQNPYVRGSTVLPDKGRRYLNRQNVRKGMIVRPGPVTKAFVAVRGWEWGGDWRTLHDYQHLSADGG
ncbi:MAG: M15 family metallopeptidase [Egibacteraceae bacterium]